MDWRAPHPRTRTGTPATTQCGSLIRAEWQSWKRFARSSLCTRSIRAVQSSRRGTLSAVRLRMPRPLVLLDGRLSNSIRSRQVHFDNPTKIPGEITIEEVVAGVKPPGGFWGTITNHNYFRVTFFKGTDKECVQNFDVGHCGKSAGSLGGDDFWFSDDEIPGNYHPGQPNLD